MLADKYFSWTQLLNWCLSLPREATPVEGLSRASEVTDAPQDFSEVLEEVRGFLWLMLHARSSRRRAARGPVAGARCVYQVIKMETPLSSF